LNAFLVDDVESSAANAHGGANKKSSMTGNIKRLFTAMVTAT
jgi:hypothetical protein